MMLFSDVSESDLDDVLQPIDNLCVPPKAVLYTHGSDGESVFTVRRGLVRLVYHSANGTRRIVRLLKPGSVAGLEVLVGAQYHHTAEAVTDADICRIPVDVLKQLEERHTSLHWALMDRWQKSLDEADLVITALSTGSAKARLARFLLQIAQDEKNRAYQYLSREDIAALLGVTLETVSRIFAEFKRNAWLEEGAQGLTLDVEQLTRVAAD